MTPNVTIIFIGLVLTSFLTQSNPTFGQVDTDCDSLKFPHFKNNIQEIEIKFTEDFTKEIDNIAKSYIDKQCKQDNLYCGDIYFKGSKHFHSLLGYDLFTFAYAFISEKNHMEKESASFFVFGIRQNGKTIFYDIADDLVGEIKLKLSGLEMEKGRTIIWGEMYPYFSKQYGKFKLTISGQETNYEFQCESHGH